MSSGTYTPAEIARIVQAPPPSGRFAGREVTGYALDSRSVRPGELFVAVRGDRFDGHDFVTRALEQGAVGALVSRDVNAPPDATLVVVPDVGAALKVLAAHHRRAHPVPIVAVTGTNGKTTTKDVVAGVLAAQADVCASVGNLNSQLGMPLTLLNRLRPHHRFGVFEVGMSARGEIAALCEVLGPSHGIVTGIGAAHTQFLGSIENVFLAKSELVSALPADGTLYLNAQCRFHGRMARAFTGRTRTVSTSEAGADVRFDISAIDLAGVRGTLSFAGESETHTLLVPIPGRHMAYPALFAVAVARDLGLDVARAVASVGECRPAPHRMSVVARGGLTILDDCYNANPMSTEALVGFVRKLGHSGRKVLVLGDMLELGDLAIEAHRRIVELVVAAASFGPIHLVGPIYRESAVGAKGVAEAVTAGRVTFHENRETVLPALRAGLADGDLLVLKASRGIGLDALVDGL